MFLFFLIQGGSNLNKINLTLNYTGSWNNEFITIIIILLFLYVFKILVSKNNEFLKKILSIFK